MIIINKIKISDFLHSGWFEAKYICNKYDCTRFFDTGNFYYNGIYVGCMRFVNDKIK